MNANASIPNEDTSTQPPIAPPPQAGQFKALLEGYLKDRTLLCELCGRWSHSLIDGVCPDCRPHPRRDEPAAGARPEPPEKPTAASIRLGPAPYTRELARRVHAFVVNLYPDLTEEAVVQIITEALFKTHLDVRAGQVVELEDIGTLRKLCLSDGPCVHFHAADALYEELPE